MLFTLIPTFLSHSSTQSKWWPKITVWTIRKKKQIIKEQLKVVQLKFYSYVKRWSFLIQSTRFVSLLLLSGSFWSQFLQIKSGWNIVRI